MRPLLPPVLTAASKLPYDALVAALARRCGALRAPRRRYRPIEAAASDRRTRHDARRFPPSINGATSASCFYSLARTQIEKKELQVCYRVDEMRWPTRRNRVEDPIQSEMLPSGHTLTKPRGRARERRLIHCCARTRAFPGRRSAVLHVVRALGFSSGTQRTYSSLWSACLVAPLGLSPSRPRWPHSACAVEALNLLLHQVRASLAVSLEATSKQPSSDLGKVFSSCRVWKTLLPSRVPQTRPPNLFLH
jgi:hypothetical protein